MKLSPTRKFRHLKSLIAVCALPLAIAAVAHATGKQDFTLHNNTDIVIHKVFCSPSDTDKWEEDIMGKDVLAAGEAVDVKFDAEEDHDLWDLKVEDADGHTHEWHKIPLEKITDLTLTDAGGNDAFTDVPKP